MDRIKSKRRNLDRKSANKKNNLSAKLQKIIKKGEKEEKRKGRRENSLKILSDTRQRRKSARKIKVIWNGVQSPGHEWLIGKSLAKGNSTREGIFLKGLRTEYVTRETLNDANEARKNEDINRIIDIGRTMVNKGSNFQGVSLRSLPVADPGSGKTSSIFDVKDFPDISLEFEGCTLSPISFAFDEGVQEEWRIGQGGNERREDWNNRRKSIQINFPNFEEELKRFSLKYEEAVGSKILKRLPKEGVLENALRSLRKTLRNEEEEAENERTEFSDGFKFLRNSPEPQISFAEQGFPFPMESTVAEGAALFQDDPMEFVARGELDDFNEFSSAFLPMLDEEEGFSFSQEKSQPSNFEKSVNELCFPTPQIQFYRRNMF